MIKMAKNIKIKKIKREKWWSYDHYELQWENNSIVKLNSSGQVISYTRNGITV